MRLISEARQALLEERIAARKPQSGRAAILQRMRQVAGIQRTIKRTVAIQRATAAARQPAPSKAVKRPGRLQPVARPAIVIKPVGQQVFLPGPKDPIEDRPMSIWSDIVGAVGRGVTARVERAATGRPTIQLPQTIQTQASILPAAGAVLAGAGRVLPSIGRVLTGRVATGAAIGAAGAQLFDQFGNPVKRRRRMNFGNARAARRAIRRIKGVRRLLKSIEDQLPRRPAPRRRAEHHHHPSAGG